MKYLGFAAAWLALSTRCSASVPPIRVSMRTSWSAPDRLLELIETVSLENPDAFFPLLDALTNPDTLSPHASRTPEALEHLVLSTAHEYGLLSRPGALQSVQMQLGLHAASPKLQAFFQHYQDVAEVKGRGRDEGRCGSWVDWYGEVVCDVDRLVELTGHETLDEKAAGEIHADPYARPKVLPFDHIYPPPSYSLTSPPRTAILHGSLTSPNFRELHAHLLALARQRTPRLEYVFRPIPQGVKEDRTNLSGYGVTLDVKKTDYLVLDDRLGGSKGSSEDSSSEGSDDTAPHVDLVLQALEAYPILNESIKLTDPLTETELQQLGIQATHLINTSPNPLATLKQLSQDFPRYASALARRVPVPQELTDELSANALRTHAGGAHVWLNGGVVPQEKMNPFSLLSLMRKERSVIASLEDLGLSADTAFKLLTHPQIDAAYSSADVLEGLFDASDRFEDGDLILWLNDIEKDERYSSWKPSVFSMMQPGPYGMPNVRLNLVNVIFAVDLTQARTHYFLASTVTGLIARKFPLRFGLVPLIPDGGERFEEGVKLAKAMVYFHETMDWPADTTFMKHLIANVRSEADLAAPISLTHARQVFDELNARPPLKEGKEKRSWDDVTDFTDELARTLVQKSQAYGKRLDLKVGLRASADEGEGEPFMHAFINGRHYDVDDSFIQSLQTDVGSFFNYFAQKVYAGELNDDIAAKTNMADYFYDLPSTYKRRNKHIVASTNPADVDIVALPTVFANTGFVTKPGAYIYPETKRVPSTMYVVADLDTEEGLAVVQYALTYLSTVEDASSRISFVHNPTTSADEKTSTSVSALFSHLIANERLGSLTPALLLHALKLHVPSDAEDSQAQETFSASEALSQVLGDISSDSIDASNYTSYLTSSRLLSKHLDLAPGVNAILVNGRIVGPFGAADWSAGAFEDLEQYEGGKRVVPALTALGEAWEGLNRLDDGEIAALVSNVVSIVSDVRIPDPSESGLYNSQLSSRNANYRRLKHEHSMFKVGDEDGAQIRFGLILDPLSGDAQRYSALLEWVYSQPGVYAEVYLLPPPYTELPLKRFYRYNLLPQLVYDESGNEVTPVSSFEDLPIEPIYTLGLDEPSSWVVRPRIAAFDLDNVQLSALSNAEVTYELDYLSIDGHAREGHFNRPPRGVQMQLVAKSNSTGAHAIADTLVMANLGYFQFRATPGVYALEIREGKGREIYEIESVGNEGWKSPSVAEGGDTVTITSFEELALYPRLMRKPGMERADVLEEEEEEEDESESVLGSVVSGVFSLFGKDKEKHEEHAVAKSRHADINIFTVASGMLYERFASIMTLSVMRHTNQTVKFWFIENFLSPSFLEFIPYLAEEYGFQYELVTYKWPKWLRAQTEKQRIIWAYKILFLDVLFPMDLDRVIFVDADQIVRADLMELVGMDLEGAPYGYTPMGDDNTDMEGFRFWKQGYWAQALQGKPYHISALYVIDLKRFRQLAAGDVLRSHYQELSADPHSLANLDQDLPNNLQRYVPIFSLPEDWLWCETWCSKDRLDRAKTIDLCQNPLTKEPKLARARQIPEWEIYDGEIARLARRLADEGVIHASAAAADVSDLANAASGKVVSTGETHEPDVDSSGEKNKHARHEEL